MASLTEGKRFARGSVDDDDSDEPKRKIPIEPYIQTRLRRGREQMRRRSQLRRLCVRFWRGEQYWYLNDRGQLNSLPTELFSGKGGKPPHRIRNTYNFIHQIVEGKVSQSTQRVPGYDITPSTTDPEDIAAARIAAQVATYGYDKWRLRRVAQKVVTNALVQREGFAYPYFDPNCGPFTDLIEVDEEGNTSESRVGQGEVRVRTMNRSEVMWEPGVDFEDSRWHAVEQAQVIDEVKAMAGYLGGGLAADANTNETPSFRDDPDERNMVLVTEYLERPSLKNPKGKREIMANGRVIFEPEDYPAKDAKGQITDDLVIHRLSYTVDPEGDDRGLVEHLIDLARTINDCWNKILEWKNRCLMPQMTAPRGSNLQRRDDTPGATFYYNVVSGQKPEWENPPPIPRELFEILDKAIEQMRTIASDVFAEPEPDLAAKTLNTAVEQSRVRWQGFLGDLAEFHSQVMRHCLTLVAQHYTEQRQIEVRGQYDWAVIPDFAGQDLRSQMNVRVLPGSLESKGRVQTLQELQFIQQNWPGAIGPDQAIAVLHSGNPDELLKSPQYDIARAARLVRLIRRGPEALQSIQPVLRAMPDGTVMEVPGWMPRRQDNIAIYKQVIGDYMKTPDFEMQPPEIQELFNLVWGGLESSEMERAIEQAMLQDQVAQRMGMTNAAAPQGGKPLPSQPSVQQEQPGGA